MREFRVGFRIRHIAAGRHIEIVQLDPARQLDNRVAAVGARAPRPRRRRREGQPRQDRDAVIALHAVHEHVAVAERREMLARKMLVRGLGLLQAQDIGLLLLKQPAHQVDGAAAPS